MAGLAGNVSTALPRILGVTTAIISAGATALKQAYADGLRAVYMIAALFGAVACIACFFLGNLRSVMTVKDLHAKHRNEGNV